MFKSVDDFNRYRDKLILMSLALTYIVLTIAYIIEYLKGNRTLSYVFIFLAILWIPYLLTFMVYKMRNENFNKFTPVALLLGYLIFYTYSLFTTTISTTWIYVFPIASLLSLLYSSCFACYLGVIYFLGINILDILLNKEVYLISNTSIVHLEQRVACLVLSLGFVIVTTTCLRKYDNMLKRIYNDVAIDPVTGLYGYNYFKDRMSNLINNSPNISYTIMLFDLDNFQYINESYGMHYSDKVLGYVSDVITDIIKSESSNNYIFKLKGDNFAIVIPNCLSDDIISLVEKVKNAISNIVLNKDSKELKLSVTSVVTDTRFIYPQHNLESLMTRLYLLESMAKSKGAGTLLEDSFDLWVNS